MSIGCSGIGRQKNEIGASSHLDHVRVVAAERQVSFCAGHPEDRAGKTPTIGVSDGLHRKIPASGD